MEPTKTLDWVGIFETLALVCQVSSKGQIYSDQSQPSASLNFIWLRIQ